MIIETQSLLCMLGINQYCNITTPCKSSTYKQKTLECDDEPTRWTCATAFHNATRNVAMANGDDCGGNLKANGCRLRTCEPPTTMEYLIYSRVNNIMQQTKNTNRLWEVGAT